MRVAVLLGDTGACGTYRMTWPAQAVKQVRQDWEILIYQPGQVGFYVSRATGELIQVSGLPPAEELDLLIVQRIGKGVVVDMMRRVQAAGCAVMLDNDDAMWAIDRQNEAWHAWNGRGHHWRVTDQAAKQADLCTNTTEALSQRYGKGRSVVIPNYLPEMALDCAPPTYDLERERPVVGWSGQVSTHPRDPLVVGDAIRQVVQDTSCRIASQPDSLAVGEMWGVEAEHVSAAKLGVDYFASLRSFDVALVPLELSTFNRAKSSLKALECAAAGCAVVATPTPANRALARDLPILMASSPVEWREHITRLVRDPAERRERGQQARAIIRERWTFEANAEQWAIAWERAVSRRTRLVSAGCR